MAARGRAWQALGPGALALLAAGPACAHPHVWITWRLTPGFSGAKVAALTEDWVMDSTFSSMLLQDLAPHHAKGTPLTPAEVAGLRDHAFANLAHYGYFNQAWAGQTALDFAAVRDFTASLQGDRLVYHFTLPLTAPVDPRATPLEVGIWDTSYYVDLEPPETGPAVSLPAGSACHAHVAPDAARPIYFGTVTPLAVRISCP